MIKENVKIFSLNEEHQPIILNYIGWNVGIILGHQLHIYKRPENSRWYTVDTNTGLYIHSYKTKKKAISNLEEDSRALDHVIKNRSKIYEKYLERFKTALEVNND